MPARNGTFSAELKPREGKLLRCTLTLQDGIIVDIRFTGDFFMMPGNAVARLEEALQGTPADELTAGIHGFFSDADVEMLGVTPEHFVEVASVAVKNLKGGSR